MDADVETIALVRHGRSTANDDPTVYLKTPDHAIPLARPTDDPDALLAGDRLATLGYDPADVCSWRSPYLRCVQTEEIVMRRVLGDAFEQIRRRDSFLLREQEFGDWDGLDEAQMEALDPVKYARRARMTDHRGRFYFRYPSGESRADVVQRMSIFLGKLHRTRFKHHVIFLHGVTQRAFRMAWFNGSSEWFETEPNPPNASVLVLSRDHERKWVERRLV
jgi:broad specificity phosphatase PhoE